MINVVKVAFVHDWLDTYRGGEKVLCSLLSLYPDAPIYTLFYDPKALPESITSRKVYAPWFLSPFIKMRKILLPILPLSTRWFHLDKYDLIISTSSCVVKGVQTIKPHVSYIHSPMRYAYDQSESYFGKYRKIFGMGILIDALLAYLRYWDRNSNSCISQIVVNSTFVGERVKNFYGRTFEVIHPPVLPPKYGSGVKKDFFVIAGALVNYKRVDLAILACKKLGVPLVILGEGPEMERLKTLQYGTFLGRCGQETWESTISEAKALLFPGIEDFGMVPVEAMASGTPVIAYKCGGALDYVIPNETGLFFEEQSVESLCKAMESFNSDQFQANVLKQHAQNFSEAKFLGKMKKVIESVI